MTSKINEGDLVVCLNFPRVNLPPFYCLALRSHYRETGYGQNFKIERMCHVLTAQGIYIIPGKYLHNFQGDKIEPS
jgi:hypothetical protein